MAARKKLMSAARCKNCRMRWVQGRDFCAACQRHFDAVRPEDVPILLSETIAPPRERVIVVDGREMTVVWDGTYRTGPG